MLGSDAIKPGHEFIDTRVVLHRAGAQWIHAQVDGVVPRRKAREVAENFDLADFGKSFDTRAPVIGTESLGGIGGGYVERRQFERALTRRRLLEDQPFTLVGVARGFLDFCVHFSVLVCRPANEGAPAKNCFLKSPASPLSSTPPQIVQFTPCPAFPSP